MSLKSVHLTHSAFFTFSSSSDPQWAPYSCRQLRVWRNLQHHLTQRFPEDLISKIRCLKKKNFFCLIDQILVMQVNIVVVLGCPIILLQKLPPKEKKTCAASLLHISP